MIHLHANILYSCGVVKDPHLNVDELPYLDRLRMIMM